MVKHLRLAKKSMKTKTIIIVLYCMFHIRIISYNLFNSMSASKFIAMKIIITKYQEI